MPGWCSSLSRSLLIQAFSLASLAAGSQPLSDRVVAYRIDGKYDPKGHAVTAIETLTYVNHTGQFLDRFPFHLYLNGFQPKATWIREAHRDGSRDFGSKSGWEEKKTGSNDILSFQADGIDLKNQIRFVAPDDGNADDRTVFEVQLPKPVAPGASITLTRRTTTGGEWCTTTLRSSGPPGLTVHRPGSISLYVAPSLARRPR